MGINEARTSRRDLPAMGPQMFQWLLLGAFTALFMDEGDRVLTTKLIRFCNKCDYYDGYHCTRPMMSCWKVNMMVENRSCRTDNFYYTHRLTGLHLYRYSKLSCEPCEEGMFQVFHDLMRETYCCTHNDRCNEPDETVYTFKAYVSHEKNRET